MAEADLRPIEGSLLKNIDCDSSVFLGAVVKVNNGVCFNAQANNFENSNAIGVCIKKRSSTKCDVLLSGVTPQIYTGLDTSKDYFLSESNAGELVDNLSLPSATDEVVLRIGRAFTDSQITVAIGLRMELDNG